MGELAGYWTGKEIEHTDFYGKDTLFISRIASARRNIDRHPEIDHVFFAQINPKFAEGMTWLTALGALFDVVTEELEKGKYVTIEVSCRAEPDMIEQLTALRRNYAGQICVLVVVEIPQPAVGGFSLKAAPEVVFNTQRKWDDGVYTASFAMLADGKTVWAEYEADVDGLPEPEHAGQGK